MTNLSIDPKQYVWAEKFRPQSIDDMVLPKTIADDFAKFVETRQIPHLLFYSPEPGLGKTTAAWAIARAITQSVLYINASSESGIDTVRTKITDFASTMGLFGSDVKVVILDEMERLKGEDGQAALRAIMERCAKNTRFILTTNYISKVIQPIQSRCSAYDFSTAFRDSDMKVGFFKRMKQVLTHEGVTFDPQDLASVVDRCYPDLRITLNTLQRMCTSGKLVVDANLTDTTLADDAWAAMASKDLVKIEEFISSRIGQNTAGVYTRLDEAIERCVKPGSRGAAIVILAEHMYKDAFVADKALNLKAAFVRISVDCDFA